MDVLSQEFLNAYVNIKNYENDLIAVGIISRIAGDQIEIRPREKRKLMTLMFGLPIKISLHQKDGVGIVLGGIVYVSNECLLVVYSVKLLKEIERRSAFRVLIDIEGMISGIVSQSHRMMRQMDEKGQKGVRILDVSIKGARFLADHWLELGRDYLLRFQLLETNFTFCAKISRIVALLDKPIEYACTFFDVQDQEDAEMCKCLYQIEAIERKWKINLNV